MTGFKIYLCTSHAPWSPHQSGYRPAKGRLDEFNISEWICVSARKKLQNGHIDNYVEILRMSDEHQCTQPCATLATGKNGDCGAYNEGLREMTKQTKDGTIAVQFHLDAGAHGGRGPMCLTNGGEYATIWAEEFLDCLEALSGVRRRGTAQFAGKYRRGVFDLSEERVKQAFGGKHFLKHGCSNAVQVEVGVATSVMDTDWLKRSGAEQAASAVVMATRRTFPIFDNGVTE